MDSNTHSTQPPERLARPQLPEQPEPLGPLGPLVQSGPPEHPEPLAALEPLEPLGPVGPLGPPEPLEHPELLEPLGPAGPPVGIAPELVGLVAAVQELAAQNLDPVPDAALNHQTLTLQWLSDCLAGQLLRRLAAVDGRGAAGADRGQPAPSTASWLRQRTRMSASVASDSVHTARALFRGPLTGTAEALLSGQISPAHARVLAQGTRHLPDQTATQAEPLLLAAARRMDPPTLRQVAGYLVDQAAPERTELARQRRYERRGLWLARTIDNLVAVNGLLEPEAGATVKTALDQLARPADANDDRTGGQRTADALTEVCRRALEAGRLPTAGGVRPQLLVTVDLDSLRNHPGPGGLGGDLGWAGSLDREACRRLACDSSVTRVLIHRHPAPDHGQPHPHDPDGSASHAGHDPSGDGPGGPESLQSRLRAAMAWLPPTLGGAPSQPLDLGRATRVITPSQRAALAVRDRGCVFPGCDRPLAWCDGHHLWHWIDGGPTNLANLALLCRAHHRSVHEDGWQLARGPDGRWTASPGPPAGRGHRNRPPPPVA